MFNPSPNKSWFLRVSSMSLLKTLWEKEKLLVMSNFCFLTVFLIHLENFQPFSSTLKLSFANSFNLEEPNILSFGKGLTLLSYAFFSGYKEVSLNYRSEPGLPNLSVSLYLRGNYVSVAMSTCLSSSMCPSLACQGMEYFHFNTLQNRKIQDLIKFDAVWCWWL